MSRPKKIKTAIWIGEKQWQALKELAENVDRSAAQLVREATGRVRWREAGVVKLRLITRLGPDLLLA
jgi:hypothetical protein